MEKVTALNWSKVLKYKEERRKNYKENIVHNSQKKNLKNKVADGPSTQSETPSTSSLNNDRVTRMSIDMHLKQQLLQQQELHKRYPNKRNEPIKFDTLEILGAYLNASGVLPRVFGTTQRPRNNKNTVCVVNGSETIKYNPKMARKHVFKQRTAEEQRLRDKNTIDARISRQRKSRAIEAAFYYEIQEYRTHEALLRLKAAMSVYLEKLKEEIKAVETNEQSIVDVLEEVEESMEVN